MCGAQVQVQIKGAPEISSPEFGWRTTEHTGALLPYSRWTPGARRSHTFTVWSSEPENSHLLSRWKPSCMCIFVSSSGADSTRHMC